HSPAEPQLGSESAKIRRKPNSSNGAARHERLRGQQSRHANGASFNRNGTLFSLWCCNSRAGCRFVTRTCGQDSMDWYRRDFCRHFPHQPVSFSSAGKLTNAMAALFCNVALPVPLRTTFTYAVPEALRASVQPGCRVLVPFRKKSLVGIVVECVE